MNIPKAQELTERQWEILSYIKRTLDVVGVAPSIQEIQQEFSFKSPNAVQTHLLALTKKGFVHRPHRQARSLRLVKGEDHPNGNGTAAMVAPHLGTAPPARRSPTDPAKDAEGHRPGNGTGPVVAPAHSPAPTAPRSPVLPVNGAEGYRDGNGRAATKTAFDDSVAAMPATSEPQLEMGVDVFFNARHVVAAELDGEVHAHSWRLRAVVLVQSPNGAPSLPLAEILQAVQGVVDEVEGTVLNTGEPFLNLEPTLERMAGWLSARIKDQLATLGVRLSSATLWDQPTQYVTVSG